MTVIKLVLSFIGMISHFSLKQIDMKKIIKGTCQCESWTLTQTYDRGLSDHTGDSENNNSFWYFDITDCTNVDVLGSDSIHTYGRVGILGDKTYVMLWPVLNGISIPISPVEIPFWALHVVVVMKETLHFCSMTNYDITIGNDTNRDVHCDVIVSLSGDQARYFCVGMFHLSFRFMKYPYTKQFT